MFHSESTLYGYKTTFSGELDLEQVKRWYRHVQTSLVESRAGFRVLLDLRKADPMPSEALLLLEMAANLYQFHGMRESVVLLPDGVTTTLPDLASRMAG
jgi:hypothetical protein